MNVDLVACPWRRNAFVEYFSAGRKFNKNLYDSLQKRPVKMSSGMRTVRFARHSGRCRSALAVIPSLSRNMFIVLLIADAPLYDGQYLVTPYIYRHGIAKNICSALRRTIFGFAIYIPSGIAKNICSALRRTIFGCAIYIPSGIAKNICSALDFCIYLRPVLGETFELIIKILELNILNEINYVLDT